MLRQRKAERAEGLLGSASCKLKGLSGNAADQNEPLYSLDFSNPTQKLLHSFFDSLYPPKAFSSNSCHLYVFGLELHQTGFHLSLSMFSLLEVSEVSCNSQVERKDKVALVLVTLQSIHCIMIIPTASVQMLDRKGTQHRALLHTASGNPSQKE